MSRVRCPNCKKPVEWNDQFPFRPFCSERCRLIDLGMWADESHRIPGPPATDEDGIDATHQSTP